MTALHSPWIPRTLLGIMGFMMLLLATGSVRAVLTYGPSAASITMFLFAIPIAFICFIAAAGLGGTRVGE